MQVLLAAVGAALVLVVFADAVKTTLMPGNGGGPITRAFTKALWPPVLRLQGTRASRLLSSAGAVLLLLTVLTWVAGLWLGWSLIFAGDTGAVVKSTTGLPADFWEIVYFSGMTVFTLGTGDYVASGDGWRLVMALASFLGLFLVTLAITYLISVVSAVVTRRSLAGVVHLYGDSGSEIVLRAWNGSGISSTALSQLDTIGSQLVSVAQLHFAYPALHVFVADDARASAPDAVDVLQDAVLILDAGLQEDVRPGEDARGPLRRAIGAYRAATNGMAHARGNAQPPPPDLSPLRDAGIPVVDDETFRRRAVGRHPLPVGSPDGR